MRAATLALLVCSLLGAQITSPTSDSEQPNPAAATPEAPPIVTCPAGGPLGAVDLRVHSPRGGDEPLPFRTINRLSEGDTLHYGPILRGKEKRPGEIALVLVPEKRAQGEDTVEVTDPKPADKPQEWKMTETISVAAFVYGPQGLSKKKVRSFLAQDQVLMAQLADYADKTAQAEALVAALSNAESSSASVNAALNGFASQYGFAVQLDRNAPVAEQAQTLFASMNPQLATYNPLASSTAARAGQTASLATVAATLFFGSPVGLAAGGTAMLLDLRAIAFPDTQFRASFAQPLPKTGVNLCGQQAPTPPHTRVAYIWATRIPNSPTPVVKIGDANFIPLTQKSPVPVDVPEPEWKYLQRARDWALVDDKQKKTPVPVLKLGNQKALEIDLTKAKLDPGVYHLTGFWDWTPFEASGEVHVLTLGDFKNARLEPASQDRLLANSGKVAATLNGSDFEFTTKVELKRVGDEFATAEPVRFLLPKGLRQGPQDHMDVQIDTHDLDPGQYDLLIAQQNGKSYPVPFRILLNPPKIDNLPILVNQGAATQHYVLKGERLALISKLEAPDAKFDLSPAGPEQTQRSLTVQLKSSVKPNTTLPITAYLTDRSEPLTFADALQITGPLPVIASSKLSLPTGMAIAVGPDEFPAGYMLTAMLDVKNMERNSVLQLGCADDPNAPASLRVGEQTGTANLQRLSQDQLFLAYDTSALPAGCALQGVIDNGRGGRSQPFTLAQIIRVPQIDSFTLDRAPRALPSSGDAAQTGNTTQAGTTAQMSNTAQTASTAQPGTTAQADNPPPSSHTYTLTGQNLEMIDKAGWDQTNAVEIAGLPTPIPGPGQKQSLSVTLPDPPTPQAVLYIWLRGDKQGRVTTIKAPSLPAAAPAATPSNPNNPPAPMPHSTASPAPHSSAAGSER